MNQLDQFHSIKTFFFDVDGVFTDNSLLCTDEGQLLRKMSVRDGYAVKRAVRAGYQIVIITGGSSEGVSDRLRNLGVHHIMSGIQDKLPIFLDFVEKQGIELDTALYMGDDLPDWEVMQRVGFPACPVDAVPEIKAISTYISPFPGGSGCVRDVIEKTLKLKGVWFPESHS